MLLIISPTIPNSGIKRNPSGITARRLTKFIFISNLVSPTAERIIGTLNVPRRINTLPISDIDRKVEEYTHLSPYIVPMSGLERTKMAITTGTMMIEAYLTDEEKTVLNRFPSFFGSILEKVGNNTVVSGAVKIVTTMVKFMAIEKLPIMTVLQKAAIKRERNWD